MLFLSVKLMDFDASFSILLSLFLSSERKMTVFFFSLKPLIEFGNNGVEVCCITWFEDNGNLLEHGPFVILRTTSLC